MTHAPTTALIESIHPLHADDRVAEHALVAHLQHLFATSASADIAYDAMSLGTPIAPGITCEEVADESVCGWWVRPPHAGPRRATLFLHGGAYMLGSARGYRGFASQLAARTGTATFVLDYPLSPLHPFPAAVDATAPAMEWLLAAGFDEIALVGDSAGGALALEACTRTGIQFPRIAAVAVFSPWVDLTLSGASMLAADTHDPIFQRQTLAAAAAAYLRGSSPRDGRASPLFAVPDKLPPLAVQVGSDELLLDDARRYANAAALRGGIVHLDVYEGLHHVFQRSTVELASARQALDAMARFIGSQWQA